MIQNSFFYACLGLFGFITIVNSIQLCVFIYNYATFNDSNGINGSKCSLIYAILAGVLFILYGIAGGYCIATNLYIDDSLTNLISYIIESILWHLSQIIVYLYFLNTLYNDFKKTPFSIPFRIFAALLAVIIMYGLFVCISIYVCIKNVLCASYKIDHWSGNDDLLMAIYGSGTVGFDALLSILILILFVHKSCKFGGYLHQIYRDDMARIQDQQNDHNRDTIIELKQTLEDKRKDITVKASKVIILSIIIWFYYHKW